MLQGIGTAASRPCAVLMSAATFSQASALRLDTTTLAPCSAMRCTMASPMPLVEPVTSATFPLRSNRFMDVSSYQLLLGGSFTADPALATRCLDFAPALGQASICS